MCNVENHHKLQGGCWLTKLGKRNYKAEKHKIKILEDQKTRHPKTRKPKDRKSRNTREIEKKETFRRWFNEIDLSVVG